FPHSDIPASQIGQHLHRAYRSRPRPSSALSAKASTVCPCSLDRKEHVCCHYGVFKVRASRSLVKDRSSGLSKLNSVIHRGQRISRRPGFRTEVSPSTSQEP